MEKFALVILSVFLFSCNEDSLSSKKPQETFWISTDEILEVLLATAIPIEGGYSISEQAEHYKMSEIQFRDKGIYYVYAPEAGFTGVDVVKIKRSDSDGARVYSETITTLKINVKD